MKDIKIDKIETVENEQETKNELKEKKGLFQKVKEAPKKVVVGVVAGVVTVAVAIVGAVVYFGKKDEKSEEENTEAKETAE